MTSLSAELPPFVTASISLTDTHPGPGRCRASKGMHLSLTLAIDAAATCSITVNTRNTILTSNDYVWDRFLAVLDAETNQEIDLLLPPSDWDEPHASDAEQLQALSFPFFATSPARHEVLTLRPGEKIVRTIISNSSCLLERYQGLLVHGKRYEIILRPAQTAQRWIWGDLDDATGFLGVNAISILDVGQVAQFAFDGSREEESSFAMPQCHIDI